MSFHSLVRLKVTDWDSESPISTAPETSRHPYTVTRLGTLYTFTCPSTVLTLTFARYVCPRNRRLLGHGGHRSGRHRHRHRRPLPRPVLTPRLSVLDSSVMVVDHAGCTACAPCVVTVPRRVPVCARRPLPRLVFGPRPWTFTRVSASIDNVRVGGDR